MGKKSNNDTQSVALNILARFAIVLSKTKEALIADLKERLFKDIDTEIDPDDIETLVENLFNLLGYDVAQLIPKEVANTTEKAFETSEELMKTVSTIAQLLNESDNFPDIFDESKQGDVDNVFFGFIKLAKNSVELIQTFKQLGNIQHESRIEEWNKFLKESNLSKDLPKRMFDQIIAAFMRNVVLVFSEDINSFKEDIKRELKSAGTELKNILTEIEGYIDEFLDDIKKGFEESLNSLGRTLRNILRKIDEILNKDLAPNFEELKKIRSLLKVEEYFRRVYAVLDFMQVISLEKVEVFSLTKGDSSVTLSTDIYVIHWARLAEMAKNPIAYFKEKYPVNNYADAEELIGRLIRMAQTWGLDVPDFDSMKSMLTDLLRRLESWLKESVASEMNELKKVIEDVVTAIKNLLMMLEQVAIEIKKKIDQELGQVFDSIVKEVRKVYAELVKNTNQLTDIKLNLGNDISTLTKNLIADIPFQSFPDRNLIIKELKNIVLPTIQTKASEYKQYADITQSDWEQLLNKMGDEVIKLFNDIKKDLSSFAQKEFASNLKDEITVALKDEFVKQTEDVPTNWADFRMKVKDNPGQLRPDKLFSKFDPYIFFSIIADKLNDTIGVFDPDSYYDKVKKAADQALVSVVNAGGTTATRFKNSVEGQNMELLKKQFVSFMSNVLIECWNELKQTLFDLVMIPFMQVTEAIAKANAQQLLADIMDGFTELTEVKQLLNELNEVPPEVKQFVKNVFPIIYDASQNGVDNWMDGLDLGMRLAKEFYKLIPANQKDELNNIISQLLGIPESISKNLNNKVTLNLPPYTLDAKNKYLSVTLYDSRNHEETDSDMFLSISLCMFVGERTKNDNKTTGVYLLPILHGELEKDFDLGDSHILKLLIEVLLNKSKDKSEKEKLIENLQNGSLGLFFAKGDIEVLNDTKNLKVTAGVEFSRKEDADKIHIIESEYLDFSINNYPQTLTVGYESNTPFLSYKGEVEKAEFVLKLRKMNDFFAEILKEDLKSDFSFSILYDTRNGFKFDGSASLKLDFDLNKKIAKTFTLNRLGLELGMPDVKGLSFMSAFNSTFTINLPSVAFSVKDLGVGIDLSLLKWDGSLGDFNLLPSFKFPTGMGVSIDASGIKGAGIIAYDESKKEFLGVLELSIFKKVEVRALAMLTMKMPDGGKGFSFIGLISVYFSPGIPLGMGFSLTGVGGAVGLNRQIDRDRVQTGVRQGEIGSVFFVKDIEENLGTMATQIGSYFPVKRDQFFFGVLARITFTKIIEVEFGLLIQAPSPTQIMIVGGLFVAIPTKKKALIELNVYFAGGIDLNEGIWFDASIVNSQIVGIQIYGDMAFRLNWGKNKGFLFSAGGFHPAYKPDAGLNVGVMQRLGMKLDYSLVKLSLESYFAVTSNTVQFGAEVNLRIGWKAVGIFGYFGFDCLFQFNPFRFLFDVRMGVEAKWGRWKLFAINLEFALSGPAKWNAKGSARFKILFITFKVKFNTSWGKSHSDNEISYISTYEIISKEFQNMDNWKLVSSGIDDEQVRIAEREADAQELILQPFDGIMFEQPSVPLDKEFQRFGEGIKPDDYTKIDISKIEIGNKVFSDLDYIEADFAPSLFFDLNDNEKLSRPSYEKMTNGLQVMSGLSERNVSTSSTETIEYYIEQDDISFAQHMVGFELREDDKVKYLAPKEESLLKASDMPNVTAVRTPLSVAFTKVSNRSDSGFNRHVTRVRKLQKAMFDDKMERVIGTENGDIVFVSKTTSRTVVDLDARKSNLRVGRRRVEARDLRLKNEIIYTSRSLRDMLIK